MLYLTVEEAVLRSQSVRGNSDFDRAAIAISVRMIICEHSQTGP
jgi:hypothetical protein